MKTERITFTSAVSGESYTGFALKEKKGRVKIGRTAGRTWGGRLQNWLAGYWYPYKLMYELERTPVIRREGTLVKLARG